MTMADVHSPPDCTTGRTSDAARRLIDFVVASASLTILSPAIAIISASILFESGWPIFFSQERLGRRGRLFRIYKFRKFHRECGTNGCGLTTKHDRRMTRLGRFLERTKLDELPQLWNILNGDMSIVGPRPESLALSDSFTGCYFAVLEHKPGVFGPNQYYFRNECALYPEAGDPENFYREVLFPLKAKIDLAYFPHRTLHSDIGWIVRGLLVVFHLRFTPNRRFDEMLASWEYSKSREGPG